jgi:hypothetical protein
MTVSRPGWAQVRVQDVRGRAGREDRPVRRRRGVRGRRRVAERVPWAGGHPAPGHPPPCSPPAPPELRPWRGPGAGAARRGCAHPARRAVCHGNDGPGRPAAEPSRDWDPALRDGATADPSPARPEARRGMQRWSNGRGPGVACSRMMGRPSRPVNAAKLSPSGFVTPGSGPSGNPSGQRSWCPWRNLSRSTRHGARESGRTHRADRAHHMT